MKENFAISVGYLTAFLVMTVMVSLLCVALFAVAIGGLSFVMWTLPPFGIFANWTLVRLFIAIGMVVGIMFACSREGDEYAEQIKETILR
jgi:hypothetical protein